MTSTDMNTKPTNKNFSIQLRVPNEKKTDKAVCVQMDGNSMKIKIDTIVLRLSFHEWQFNMLNYLHKYNTHQSEFMIEFYENIAGYLMNVDKVNIINMPYQNSMRQHSTIF